MAKLMTTEELKNFNTMHGNAEFLAPGTYTVTCLSVRLSENKLWFYVLPNEVQVKGCFCIQVPNDNSSDAFKEHFIAEISALCVQINTFSKDDMTFEQIGNFAATSAVGKTFKIQVNANSYQKGVKIGADGKPIVDPMVGKYVLSAMGNVKLNPNLFYEEAITAEKEKERLIKKGIAPSLITF